MQFPIPEVLQPLMPWLAFILGSVIGSFLNVMGLRLLAEESFVHPPSHCPKCQARIQPYDNIPVISYILLGGQCRSCKTGISIQYPLVELGTGLLFALTIWHFGVSIQSLLLLFLVSNLMVIMITDFRESLIFQINSLTLIPAGLIFNLLGSGLHGTGGIPVDLGAIAFQIPDGLISAIIGMMVMLVFFEGLILLSQLAFGTEGFGHGDTHLMMGVCAYIGWELGLLGLMLGFIVQSVPAIPMLVWQWYKNKEYVSLFSGGGGVVFGMLPLALLNAPIEPGLKSLATILCFVLAIVSLFVFLRQVRERQSFTYMPLGPALVVGSLTALFWGREIFQALYP